MNISLIIKNKLVNLGLKGTNNVLIDAKELADLKIRALDNLGRTPLSKAQLTQLQLGTYIPNFEDLSKKPDDFKNKIGRMCRDLVRSEEWEYLITHLKQEQVNKSLFTEGISYTEDFIRGTINGIYVVDANINDLGSNYDQRLIEGTLTEKPKRKSN